MLFSFFAGLLFGFLCLLGLEVLIFLYVLDWIEKKNKAAIDLLEKAESCDLSGENSINLSSNKEGYVWILEPDKILDLKDKKEKNNYVVVVPVKKHARIEDHLLILTGPGSSQINIDLSNCTVLAVSASNQSTRKWAKRYPIKIESKEPSVHIYNNTPTIFLYCETSWEKESWCKVLRIASTTDKGKLQSRQKLIQNYEKYLIALNAEYPSFTKPYSLFNAELSDRTVRAQPGKVKTFIKKIVRKASNKPANLESRLSGFSQYEGGKRVLENVESSRASLQDLQSEAVGLDERVSSDESAICLNLFFSRLFFDFKMSDKINTAIHARIQRALSSMRVPSYIGSLSLTNFSLSALPPHIRRLKPVQSNPAELTAFEADFELLGGLLVNVETRLDLRATEMEWGEGENLGLLEGLEDFGRQFSSPQLEIKDEIVGQEGLLKHSKSASWASTYTSRWKNIVNSIATKFNQVPLSLAIRANSIRGTLRFHIKPPPSDHIWYGFTSMPEIDWYIESSIGEKKITSNRIASLLGNRFKASICSTLVLPNCESISIPWMLSETDDWAPLKSAPFIWINHENTPNNPKNYENTPNSKIQENAPKTDISTSTNAITRADSAPCKDEIVKSVELAKEESNEGAEMEASSSNGITGGLGFMNLEKQASSGSEVFTDFSAPVVVQRNLTVESFVPNRESVERNREDSKLNLRGESFVPNREDSNLYLRGESNREESKLSRRRFSDFGRKMGDKFGENRRKIEEKGRHLVEKVRENMNTTQ